MDEDPQFTRTLLSQSRLAARVGASESSGATPKPGDVIDRYHVRERIGEGGMGVVYAAEDPELGRVVAIKLLRSVEGSDAEANQRRLLREAQALARVSHRNLVTVFDVGTRDGRVWIAMEYVVGVTLEEWLNSERRTWREIVDVFIEAGRGLAAVHGVGLVHRDFKPGNVIVRGDGTVQVLDFGLVAQAGERVVTAETGDRGARPALDALAAALTETGGIMGTPAYMAPEQFLQVSADARADQFSFSVALFEALYGHRPFKGKDLPELMRAAIDGLPGLPPELPGVPLRLRQAIARGMSPKPEDRFEDMHAMIQLLEGTRAPAIVRAGGGWSRFTLGMLVGGGALAGFFVWLSRADDEGEPPPAAATPAAKSQAGEESPDDKALAPAEPEEDPEGEIVIFPLDLPSAVPDEPDSSQLGAGGGGEGTMPTVVEIPGTGVRLPGLQDLDEQGGSGGAAPPPDTKPPEAKPPGEGKTDAGATDDKPTHEVKPPNPPDEADSPPP